METVQWVKAPEYPEEGQMVLLDHPGIPGYPVWPGFRENGFWWTAGGGLLLESDVVAWARMPVGSEGLP